MRWLTLAAGLSAGVASSNMFGQQQVGRSEGEGEEEIERGEVRIGMRKKIKLPHYSYTCEHCVEASVASCLG